MLFCSTIRRLFLHVAPFVSFHHALPLPRLCDIETFPSSGEERPMPSPLLQSGSCSQNMSKSRHPINAYVTEFFVPLDRASEALEAVSQESSKWPGWLQSETAKGTKYESCPLVFHCEVRVGKFCNANPECANVLRSLNNMQLQGIPLLWA